MKKLTVRTKDSSSWDVMNPEILKGREGHHVQLGGHVYVDKNGKSTVMTWKTLKADSMESASRQNL